MHKARARHGWIVSADTGRVNSKCLTHTSDLGTMGWPYSLTCVVLFLDFPPIFLLNNTSKHCFLTLLVFSLAAVINF